MDSQTLFPVAPFQGASYLVINLVLVEKGGCSLDKILIKLLFSSYSHYQFAAIQFDTCLYLISTTILFPKFIIINIINLIIIIIIIILLFIYCLLLSLLFFIYLFIYFL